MVLKTFCVAESAKISVDRKVFNEMLAFVEGNPTKIHGVVFNTVDRATRNHQDIARIEDLWTQHSIDTFIVDGNLKMSDLNNSLMIGIQGVMARYSNLDYGQRVSICQERMLNEGRMPYRAPFGYQNYRIGSKADVRIHPENGLEVQRIFEIYAYETISVRDLIKRLVNEGITYTERYPGFNKSTLYKVLRNRTYLGDLPTKNGWIPGVHDPLIDIATFEHVAARLGDRQNTRTSIPYAGLMKCGHCGRKVTGELIRRGERRYIYYRCAGYTAPGHPRVRLTESEVDEQFLRFLQGMHCDDPELQEWFRVAIRAAAQKRQSASEARRSRFRASFTRIEKEEGGLFKMRMNEEINSKEFATQRDHLRSEKLSIEKELAADSMDHADTSDAAIKAFELADQLADKWLSADALTGRTIIETVSLNIELKDGSLDITAASPFDLLLQLEEVGNGRSERV